MLQNYDSLFTPFKIGNLELKNRIVMSPMGTHSANPDGCVSTEEIDYFEARAKGGAGMIITSVQYISKESARGSVNNVMEDAYALPRLTELCEAVQRYGARICAQLTCGEGRYNGTMWQGGPPVSASPVPALFLPDVICHPLSVEEIQRIMQQFEDAASMAKKAGFDAIEIHGHAGYLIDQFMSPLWNKREDEYGGSEENRARFPREIIRSIRKGAGPDMPIIFRIALDHCFEGGRTLKDSMPLIQFLEAEGVDAIDVDAGAWESVDYVFPPTYLGDACLAYVCEPARKAVKIPILNSGNHTPETAAALIASGNADFIMFGRQMIADPEMPNKLMHGRREDVRPCIRCNEDCVGRIVGRDTKLSCSVNPQALNEKRFQLQPAATPKHVVIVGAGPAGMEAARVAALQGHTVSLFEKEGIVGGQLAVAATPDFKRPLRALVDWYEVQVKKLGIDLRLGTAVTADDEILAASDRIIVATGAIPMTLPIPGIDGPNVINVIDAHRNKDAVKGVNVVVCGGGLSGCDCALELADAHGKHVTIVEMVDDIAKDMMPFNTVSLKAKLRDARVDIRTGNKVTAMDETGVHVQKADGTTDVIPADTIVTAFGMKKNNKLAEAIKAKYHTKTRLVGDCEAVGKVGTAVRMGFFAGSSLD